MVDDSPNKSAKSIVERFKSGYEELGSRLIYLQGTGAGNTTARNIGIPAAKGNALLFLDDDILLEKNSVLLLAKFLVKNPEAVGVQPVITAFEDYWFSMDFWARLGNEVHRALMLSYHARDRQEVRRSAASVFGSLITRTISVQRTSGCCLFWRKSIDGLRFDPNLQRRGLYDDVDFSYRIYQRHRNGLFCILESRIVHKSSRMARLPRGTDELMGVIYWTYLFFKDVYQGSLLNLLAFLWAFIGGFTLSSLQFTLSPDLDEKWAHIYRLRAYPICLRNLRSIIIRNLDFFNRTL